MEQDVSLTHKPTEFFRLNCGTETFFCFILQTKALTATLFPFSTTATNQNPVSELNFPSDKPKSLIDINSEINAHIPKLALLLSSSLCSHIETLLLIKGPDRK